GRRRMDRGAVNTTEPSTEGPSLAHDARPVWRVVVVLAIPVLLQQFLLLTVSLSDRFLAGHYSAVSPREQAEAIGHRFMALGLLAGPSPPGFPANVLAAEVPW